jgi:hypothetical protein
MKLLIAIISCKTHAGYRAAIRETWLPKVPRDKADAFFFMGRGAESIESDEIVLDDCGDDYWSLPSKVQAIDRWALEHEYTNLVKIDNDVILKVPEFLASGFQNHDFAGHTNNDGDVVKIPWGFMYTLSRKSMDIVANAQLPPHQNDEAWVSYNLAQHGILLHHESQYILHHGKRSDFIVPRKRPLRAPPRNFHMEEETRRDAIATCIFLQHFGYHKTPDEVNIKEYYKLFKETQG